MSTVVGGSTSASGPTTTVAGSNSASMSAHETDDASSLSSSASVTLSTTTTEMVRDRSRTPVLDTFSIIALSIGGAVMLTLVVCTFRRCVVWMREQRSARSGDLFMLLDQEQADDADPNYWVDQQ